MASPGEQFYVTTTRGRQLPVSLLMQDDRNALSAPLRWCMHHQSARRKQQQE